MVDVIERSAKKPLFWLVLLALGSGAGLLLFAFGNIIESAEQSGREQARRSADQLAAALRAGLSVSVLPDIGRFELVAGELQVDPAFGSLHEVPLPYDEARLPTQAWARLRAARHEEVANEDREKAAAAMADALAHTGLAARDRTYLLREAAWQAYRFGNADLAQDRLLELLQDKTLGPATAASALLLLRTLGLDGTEGDGSKVAPRLERRVAILPAAARVGISIPPRVEDRRRVLVALDREGKRLQHGAVLEAIDGIDARGWLVLLDQPVDQTQQGGIVPLAALRHHWAGGGDPMAGRFLIKGAAGATVQQPENIVLYPPDQELLDVVPIYAGIGVRVVVPTPTFWADPIVLRSLLGLLALCFALALFFAFRMLLRESADMRSRADFLTSVTHELKTPLSSIRLLSEMLDEGRVQGEQKKSDYYKLLAGESSRLTALIENVLDLGRMERGERAHDPQPNVPDEVVEEAVAVFAPVASREHMRIEVDLAADDRSTPIDRGALVQALLNVLENARKYAKTGPVEIESRSDRDWYRLSIRDHGAGIPAAQREVIFERFRRGEAQKDGSVPGVGLGLYLARTILRAHGGELECVATEGPGAEFAFTIPYPAVPASAAPTQGVRQA